jgi:hypothetical protein
MFLWSPKQECPASARWVRGCFCMTEKGLSPRVTSQFVFFGDILVFCIILHCLRGFIHPTTRDGRQEKQWLATIEARS